MTNWYNEIDPYAARHLRNLIDAGHIAPGVVDERSIEDVKPEDLSGFTQCHFFAGVGVWSYALRRAGWDDSKPVWTGSCPCQPFSTAGKGNGFADKRHLWPAWQWLIEQCKPTNILGEQVASKAVEPWIDLVQADLEAMGYAFGCVPFPAAGIGAPNIRDRAYWVAHSSSARLSKRISLGGIQPTSVRTSEREAANCYGTPLRMDNTTLLGFDGVGRGGTWEERIAKSDQTGGLANTNSNRCNQVRQCESSIWRNGFIGNDGLFAEQPWACPVNGFWRNADWLLCRDGKWRPVEPGTFPLANGAPARVGRLRTYGNAINAEQATNFIVCAKEILEE